MANEKYVSLLQQGVEFWNLHAKDFSHRIDLSNFDFRNKQLQGINFFAAYLKGSNFANANLENADLSGSDLSEADFSHARLSYADLTGADLLKANLFCADLTKASLIRAQLTGAILKGATLGETNLCWANLRGSNLENSELDATIFGDTDLSEARLDSCRHYGACIIDLQTIAKSWPLPLNFLRGCGVPDKLIEFLPQLIVEPMEFYSCFLSYSEQDREFAERLHTDLQSVGVRTWFAPEDLLAGDRIYSRIDESIRLHDKVLLVLSEHSISSRWVEIEVKNALEEERRQRRTILFPIRLDDSVFQSSQAWAIDLRESRNIGDFRNWAAGTQYKKSLSRLLKGLTLSLATETTQGARQ